MRNVHPLSLLHFLELCNVTLCDFRQNSRVSDLITPKNEEGSMFVLIGGCFMEIYTVSLDNNFY